ncbi:MAG: nucleotidyltransferase family protein [Victivallaceae bacterium]
MDRVQNNFCMILRDNLSATCKHDIENMLLEEWNSIYHVGYCNNLLPLLYYKLKTHKISVPSQIEITLRNDYLNYSGRDLKRKSQLLEMIKLFNDNGIEHILLKGSHLAEIVYTNSALRMMGDIDILVSHKDIEKAFNVLINEGYYDGSQPDGSNIVKDVYVHHYPVLYKDNLFPVELHRYLFENNDLKNIDLIWSRAQTVNIGGMASKVMELEDMLVYTALHGLKYHTQKLGVNFLYDLHAIIIQGNINWDIVAERIKDNDWGNSKTLYSALVMTKKYLNTNIPEFFLNVIRPVDYSQKIQAIIEELILCRKIHNQTAYTFSFYLFHALKKMSFKRIAGQALFSPEQISSKTRNRYNGWRIAALYFQSVMSIFTTFLKIIYQSFGVGDNDAKKAFSAGRKAGIFTHWLES